MLVYFIHCRVSGKTYVGQTKDHLEVRWKEHLATAFNRGEHRSVLHSAIRKYGPEAFDLGVLRDDLDKEEADHFEALFITMLGTHVSTGCGYNLTSGGEGTVGYRHSEETKNKVRANPYHTHRPPISEETRKRMSVARKKRVITPKMKEALRRCCNSQDRLAQSIRMKNWWEERRSQENFNG